MEAISANLDYTHEPFATFSPLSTRGGLNPAVMRGLRAYYKPRWPIIPEGPPYVNDAPAISQLYAGRPAFNLGAEDEYPDTPIANEIPLQNYRDSEGNVGKISFGPKRRKKLNYIYKTWIVVFNSKSQQYVALRQKNWELHIDTSNAGPWEVEPKPEVTPVEQPSARIDSVTRYLDKTDPMRPQLKNFMEIEKGPVTPIKNN